MILQCQLEQLRTLMVACQCSKGNWSTSSPTGISERILPPSEPARLKPAVVESDHLQQGVVTKPTGHLNLILVAQLINAPVATG